MNTHFLSEIPSSSYESSNENECEFSENIGHISNLKADSEKFDLKSFKSSTTPPCDNENEGTSTPPKKVSLNELELEREDFESVGDIDVKNSRSKSESSEKELTFRRKKDRKIRNYRRNLNRKSPSVPPVESENSPLKKEKDKTKTKYPKNWEEFIKEKWDFQKLNSKNHSKLLKSTDDITRQLLFKIPSELIKSSYYKAENGESIHIPYSYLRHTTAKPQITYNVNLNAIKDVHLNRNEVLNATNKDFKEILDKFLRRNSVKKFKQSEPIGQRSWYQKIWKEDLKCLETSMGLSFLQSYSGGEEEEDYCEPPPISEEKETRQSNKSKNNKNTQKQESNEEMSWTPERKSTTEVTSLVSTTPKKIELDLSWEKLEEEKVELKPNLLKEKTKRKKESSKKNKKKKHKSETETSSSSSDTDNDKKRKKNKNSKKKKLKEKSKKRKKEILKAEKLKKLKKKRKKEKEREIEREILKKLKKEIELNLVKVENEERETVLKIETEEIKTPEPISNQQNDNNVKLEEPQTPTMSKLIINSSPKKISKESNCSTPNTDEYHSNWESEGETVSNFESPTKIAEKRDLEMPLNIRCFARRERLELSPTSSEQSIKPKIIDVDAELKRLEEERLKLSNERMRLELEKIKLREMEMMRTLESTEITCNLEGAIFRKKLSKKRTTRWDLDEHKSDKKDFKIDPNAFTISNSPEITSTKSPTDPNPLENIYEEFMKAVSNGDESKDGLPTSTEKNNLTDADKSPEKFLPLPSISPKKFLVDPQEFSLTNQNDSCEKEKERFNDEFSDVSTLNESPSKPINFSSLVIPSKKSSMLEKTNWKVDEDSEDETRPITETQGKIESEKIEKNKNVDIETSNKRKKEKSPSVDTSKRRKSEESKRRSDDKRRNSTSYARKYKESDRRRPIRCRGSLSPRRRRNLSPHRRRSPLLRRHESLKRKRSPMRKRRSSTPIKQTHKRTPSPKSPIDELKKSVADSTISDDSLLLPQIHPDNSSSPLSNNTTCKRLKNSTNLSPKRPSLDERINQVLGLETTNQPTWKQQQQQQQTDPYHHNYQEYYQHDNYHEFEQKNTQNLTLTNQTKVLQVGNILQVVPSEDVSIPLSTDTITPSTQRILQVGNMLQIVPTELIPPPPPPLPQKEIVKQHQKDDLDEKFEKDTKEFEKAQKKLEKLERKKERERRRKEREKKIKQKLKVTTEEMIKRALELEGYIEDEAGIVETVPEIISETPGIDASKSILRNHDELKTERKKSVQFADGVRPGYGTSPSCGEELSSPPPPQTENLPKTKRLKKLEKLRKKKRKIKVKVVKSRSNDSDDEYENLPPPSPPPGSPPIHVFPQRVKVHTINNIPQHYLPAYGVQTAPQQPQQQMAQFQIPSTAIYRTQTAQHVIGQNFNRPTSSIPRGDQTYGTF